MEPLHITHLEEIIELYPATKVVHTVADILEERADLSPDPSIRKRVRKFANELRKTSNHNRSI